jgi:hypothetical protein
VVIEFVVTVGEQRRTTVKLIMYFSTMTETSVQKKALMLLLSDASTTVVEHSRNVVIELVEMLNYRSYYKKSNTKSFIS